MISQKSLKTGTIGREVSIYRQEEIEFRIEKEMDAKSGGDEKIRLCERCEVIAMNCTEKSASRGGHAE